MPDCSAWLSPLLGSLRRFLIEDDSRLVALLRAVAGL